MIDTNKIRFLCKELDELCAKLEDLRVKRNLLNKHSEHIQIVFNYGKQSVSIATTELGPDYQHHFIRGREMIDLGAKLLLNRLIEDTETKIKQLEARLNVV